MKISGLAVASVMTWAMRIEASTETADMVLAKGEIIQPLE